MTASVLEARVAPELWAGAECTLNRIANVFQDQSVLTGHGTRDSDLERFAQLGISSLRYPLLWETFAQSHDVARLWAWHDTRLDRLRQLGIRPILGLVHHGSGPITTSLVAPNFSNGLAEHAAHAAERYPWVRDWTPVNEPLTTARFSALYGHWYPHLKNEAAFWLALLNQLDGVIAAMAAIRSFNPAARLIQTEDLGHTGATRPLAAQAAFYNERRWATWDILNGDVVHGHFLWNHVAGLGFEDRLATVAAAPCPPDVLGLNHYLTSDRFLDHRTAAYPGHSGNDSAYGPLIDIEAVRSGEAHPGLAGAIEDCWKRYRVPIALTEIHNGCTREEQMRWLDEAWTTAGRLSAQGVAIEAVTVWSLLGAFDWDSLLTCSQGRYETGAFDVRGGEPRATAMVPMIRQLATGNRPDHPVLAAAGWWKRRGDLHNEPSPELMAFAGGERPLLIVGATGTLGQAFAGACRLRGIRYVLTGREHLDLLSRVSIEQSLADNNPWAVINCAGWVRVDEAESRAADCMAVNVAGNLALADACRRRDIHYTCFSSDLVFDGSSSSGYTERDSPRPLNVYGRSKADADAAIAAEGSRCLVVRTASFFSPFDDQNFAVHLTARLREGKTFDAADDCVTSPTYVPDLVRVVLDLVIDDDTGLRHLVNDGAVSWAEFGERLATRLELPANLVRPRPAADMGWAAPRPAYCALRTVRGQLLPTLTEAIERFAAHPRNACVTADAMNR